MPMLPVMPSGAPSAPARPGKLADSGAKGAFQSVLNHETENAAQPQAPPEGMASQQNATPDTQPQTDPTKVQNAAERPASTEEETADQLEQAGLAALQNIAPSAQAPPVAAPPTPESVAAQQDAQTAEGAPDRAQASNAAMASAGSEQPSLEAESFGQPAPSAPATTATREAGSISAFEANAQAPVTKDENPAAAATAVSAADRAVAADPAETIAVHAEQTPPASAATPTTDQNPQRTTAKNATAADVSAAERATNGQAAAATPPAFLGEERFAQVLNRRNDTQVSAEAVATTVARQPAATGILAVQLQPAPVRQSQAPGRTRADAAGEPSSELHGTDMSLAENSQGLADAPVGIPSPDTAAMPQPVVKAGLAPSGGEADASAWPGSHEQAAAGFAPPQAATGEAVSAARTATTAQTPTFTASEQEVMEQVIQRSSLKELEGRRHLTVELHPKDLGQVKLDLVQENNRLQLHLQAQHGDVRDILQKHLPRLQEALQQQGLMLDDVQVSVDSQSGNAQGFFEQRQRQARHNPWLNDRSAPLQTEVPAMAARTATQTSNRGLSLRI